MRHLVRLSLLLFLLAGGSVSSNSLTQNKPPADSGGGSGFGKDEHDLGSWKEFISEEGRFSLLLPGVPEEVTREIDSPLGKARGHYFNVFTFADFGFSYTQLPVNVETPEVARKLLDQARDGLLARFRGKLLEEKEISLDGHPGRFMKVELASGSIARHKIFIAGSRTYQVVFISRDKGVPPAVLSHHESAAKKYLDSFKLR